MSSKFLRLDDDVRAIKGVGDVKAMLLERLGIRTVENLLYFFPRRYEDRRNIVKIADLIPGGAPQAFKAFVVSVEQRVARNNRNMHITRACLSDGKTVAWALWFNRKSLSMILKSGMELSLYGKLESGHRSLELLNPEFEILGNGEPQNAGRIVPIYSTTAGLNDKWLRRTISNLLGSFSELLPEYLPEYIVKKYGFMSPYEAVCEMHSPSDEKTYVNAKKRLVFEEFFLLQLGLALRRQKRENGIVAPSLNAPKKLVNEFLKRLPFNLTDDQLAVIKEISSDISTNVPMNRLLQGDVGSGKTVVAVSAMLQALDSNYQAVLMAPTSVLAKQHADVLNKWLNPMGIDVALLTGGTSLAEKRKIYAGLASGEIMIAVGTHALIQENVKFERLGLIVIDEQHRFGVLQRKALSSKSSGSTSHSLVMTATPIPRTLALSVYGDLSVSTIRTLPKGRLPIRTVCIGDNRLKGMLNFLDSEISAGRQVYWICPLIEESQNFDAAPLEQRYEKLKAVFPKRRIGILHGRMSDKEKNSVMNDFLAGKFDILASTTVIEVGIDVPNASVIVIENAERFGLSQLHQLRGRVGRGLYKSWCILYSNNSNHEVRYRLEKFCSLTDGFAVAEADMKLRGPGEFCGVRQHGLTDFRIADLTRDGDSMELARKEAFSLVEQSDLYREYPLLMKSVHQRYGRLLEIAQIA